ncbi:MAG: hypothetical protein KKE96_03485 [Candidatus Altiarchaeota archaeon]|nr:hypothetical protein [Candidatus Altiarchaeota archaeon]MBU4342188.1 hypothetical protein [Candidatus Altiarchaeota archaeon]MBU4406555.1 hypothetical protein [Candidatus Altiarchaeota archaeon]
MKNKILFLAAMVVLSPMISVNGDDYGMMDGNGMMGGAGMLGAGLFGLIYLAIAAFIVSVIFWLTYKWIVKEDKK